MGSCKAVFAYRPGINILTLSGEIDFFCYPALKKFLKVKLGANAQPLVFDLSSVSFMDSTGGLRLLLEISDNVGRHRVALAGANKHVANLIRSANISPVTLCKDIPAAAATFRDRGLHEREIKKSA